MWRDHDPRWDDADRSRDDEIERPDPSRGSRGASDPREVLPRDPRDVFTRGLALPRGSRRQRVTFRDRSYELRGSEVRLLATVGAFRAVPQRDLERSESDNVARREKDIEHLRSAGLIETRPFGAGSSRTTLVTLTDRGRELLEAAQDRSIEDRQQFYAGFARRPEIAHDAQLHRAYEHAAERIKDRGGRIRRIVLDYELKREYQRFLQERNRRDRESDGRPDRTVDEVREWTLAHRLPYEDEHVQFPDVRIEYEDRDGRREIEDLEVITPHYRGAHAAAKGRSGFQQYRSSGGRVGGRCSRGGRGRPFDPRVAEDILS
jgi:DNA-binding MarR family transcriptional regulator